MMKIPYRLYFQREDMVMLWQKSALVVLGIMGRRKKA
jgi:hypothetical protein